MGLISFSTFAGAVAGLTAWALVEPFAPQRFFDDGWLAWQLWFAIALGSFIAATLGAVLGYAQGSRAHIIRGFFLGAVIGAIGGSAGLSLGGAIANGIFGNVLGNAELDAGDIPARIAIFIPFGALIGLVMGVPGRSWRQAWIGMIGGAIGGAIGGGLFDLVSASTAGLSLALKGGDESGIVGRALTSVIIGGAIGLVTSLIQRASRSAWLRLTLGRNEGKEWVVDAPQTFIGRNESAHVPLFGDNSVAPMHACIARQGPNYILMDGGSPVGTYLNGQPVKQMPLFHGAIIRVGGYDLQFLMRTGQAPVYGPEALRSMSQYPVQPQAAPPAGVQNMAGPVATMAVPPAGMVTQAVPSLVQASTLVALGGPLVGQRFAVHGPLEIGREGAGIPVASDASASRRHAIVSSGAGGLQLTDLNSTNGTFVNEQRVQNSALKPGDVVRIGTTTFRVE